MDIGKSKPPLGEKPRMSVRRNSLEIGESSDRSDRNLLRNISQRIDNLGMQLNKLA